MFISGDDILLKKKKETFKLFNISDDNTGKDWVLSWLPESHTGHHRLEVVRCLLC